MWIRTKYCNEKCSRCGDDGCAREESRCTRVNDHLCYNCMQDSSRSTTTAMIKEEPKPKIKFSLSESEQKKASDWLVSHKNVCSIKNEGAIGGTTSWIFTPTSIGTVVVLNCACGETVDVSEYEHW